MSLNGKKILVTCGPVWSRIDAVRVISNVSSGRLGQTIAALCRKKNAKVTLLLGPVTEKVIRKASCPTMIVPRRAPESTGASIS